jgi:hypothetical protein
MADAFIYYRLESNNTDTDVGNPLYPNPNSDRNTFVTNMESNFPAQILRFTLPEELLESVSMSYENNIKDSPTSEPDGTRRMNKQDNGLMGIKYVFRGRFKDASSDITTLINMARLLQVESTTDPDALGFGKFGFFTDNTTLKPFNLDPNSTKGLTIRSFSINRSGQTPKNFDFEILMTFGGTYTGTE